MGTLGKERLEMPSESAGLVSPLLGWREHISRRWQAVDTPGYALPNRPCLLRALCIGEQRALPPPAGQASRHLVVGQLFTI